MAEKFEAEKKFVSVRPETEITSKLIICLKLCLSSRMNDGSSSLAIDMTSKSLYEFGIVFIEFYDWFQVLFFNFRKRNIYFFNV